MGLQGCLQCLFLPKRMRFLKRIPTMPTCICNVIAVLRQISAGEPWQGMASLRLRTAKAWVSITSKTLTSLNKESRPFFIGDNSIWSLAHRNRSDCCDLRLRCPSRTPEIAAISCDLRARWKVASDLRFRAPISQNPFFLRDFWRFGSVNAEIASDCDRAILVR